jgi:dTDP-4-amino-4,6-dideoxygalactose transaminase
MKVPLLDLHGQYAGIRGEVLDALTRVCDSQHFILGEDVAQLEREMCEYIGVPHAFAVSSGTDALLLALMALEVGPGDEVITSIYNQFVVRLEERDELRAHLADRGVGAEVYYPVPFHVQECFAYLGYRKGAFPHAEAAASQSLALPIYPELTEPQQSYVAECVAEYCLAAPR